ncbi:GNAT family N-acetyltransferase [Mycetohabitans sp. B46]
MIEWRVRHFAELSVADVYDMLDVRSEVFVVEQRCIYRDIDQLDWQAWRLFARDTRLPGRPCAGYLRVLSAAQHDARADRVIGRVLASPRHRGDGLGRALMAQALDPIGSRWPSTAVRLHAQVHLPCFYRGFGFEPISDEHDNDSIASIWMRRL